MIVSQNYTAVVPGVNFVQFVASGGTAPYTYAVLPNGAGGTIDSTTGAYTAPSSMTAYPASMMIDTIQVTDSLAVTQTATILVGTPLFLFCDILQRGMNLSNGRIFVWDQKIFQPTDSGLYVIVSLTSCKPFGNDSEPVGTDGALVQQFVSMYAKIDVDVISRGPSARDRKEEVVMAINSTYSEQQQEANGFHIGRVPISGGFINLSQIDGAAIPYRYKISFGMQYVTSKILSVDYYDNFDSPEITTDS